MREIERRLHRLEDAARPGVAGVLFMPERLNPTTNAARFAEFVALVDSGSDALPPHLASCPSPVAWRRFVADAVAAGMVRPDRVACQ
jgi:hypothetical protein